MSDSEFTFFGQKVEKITLAIGLAMIIWGGVVTMISDSQSHIFNTLCPWATNACFWIPCH